MKYGYARVSTDGQSVDAQVRQLAKAGCKKVFREVASGAKTDRAQLRRLLDVLDAGDHRQEGRISSPGRRLGRHYDIARTLDADRARRPGRV
jgi:DNA invertase Pin-like site-specific DNA recombinase